MKNRRKWLGLPAAAALAAAAYFSLDWALGAIVHHRKAVTVPDLVGKPVPEALNLLGASGLSLLKEEEKFDKRFPSGVIIRQSPPAGVAVREGRTVRVTLSQGGETIYVPDIVGQPYRHAQAQLQNAGLSVGEIERRPSLRYERDLVMATDPPGRAVVTENGLVNLVVSDGPPHSDVLLTPDFVGRTIAEVKRWAAAKEIAVSTKEDDDIARSPGEILQQFPTADSPIRAGDALHVVVNAGPAEEGARGRVLFDVPAGGGDRDIRVMMIDESGEREVYRRAHPPGSRVDFRVEPKGRARARIFVNGIMVEEQEL